MLVDTSSAKQAPACAYQGPWLVECCSLPACQGCSKGRLPQGPKDKVRHTQQVLPRAVWLPWGLALAHLLLCTVWSDSMLYSALQLP
jgi:hypothetical protein